MSLLTHPLRYVPVHVILYHMPLKKIDSGFSIICDFYLFCSFILGSTIVQTISHDTNSPKLDSRGSECGMVSNKTHPHILQHSYRVSMKLCLMGSILVGL